MEDMGVAEDDMGEGGAFAYATPSEPGYEGCIICINLVLPMGWVESPKFFCAFLETLTDMANNLVDTDLLVLSYGAISDIPETESGSSCPGPISPGTFTLS